MSNERDEDPLAYRAEKVEQLYRDLTELTSNELIRAIAWELLSVIQAS